MVLDQTTARRLLDEGQSPWLDTIKRAMLLDGAFQRLLDRNIVDMTRDPRAIQKATGGSDDDLGHLVHGGESVAAVCHDLAPDDSHAAGALLRLISSYYAGTGTEAAVHTNGGERESRPWT